jgi:enamine deaminase RidA (YjgF/YER057c/UK114 family)
MPFAGHMKISPPGWTRPKGYANGVVANGSMVFLGGLVGWNAKQEFETDDFVCQVRQTLENIRTVLAEIDAGPEHVVRLTWYITNKREYLDRLREVGTVYREVMGREFPAMALVQVSALLEGRAKVEIEATAVVPVRRSVSKDADR